MAYFLHYYGALSAYTDERNNNYEEPWVSLTEESTSAIVNYNKTEEEKLLETPLTFEILSDGNIVWKLVPGTARTIQYSLNGGEWTNITATTAGTEIQVSSGDTVQFRGDNTRYGSGLSGNSFSGTTCRFNVKGNIMSLIDSDDFVTADFFPTPSTYQYAFSALFQRCTGLTDASKLILPKHTTFNGYYYLFYRCTNLKTSPKLPTALLLSSCYAGMFYGCSSLIEAPEIPVPETGAAQSYCCDSMFCDCTSLIKAPSVLASPTLETACYRGMFRGCSSLTKAPVLLGEFNSSSNYQYEQMFSGCTSLNYIKCLTSTLNYTVMLNKCSEWTAFVASEGVFVRKAGEQWPSGANGIPTGWVVEDDPGTAISS